jgi:Ca2+-binding EF-hand superfamily protein
MRIALRRLPFMIVTLAVASAAAAQEKAPSYEPKQAFEEADGNQDGVVDQPELYARFTEVFFFNDKDKDGFLDVTEYQATRAADGNFQKADADGDGRISLREFYRASSLGAEEIDLNKDGVLTLEEVETAWRPAPAP